MLKRIVSIAIFTGLGQLFSILAIKYVSQHTSSNQLKSIAEIDSLTQFILNVIGLGMQSAAMRDLALSENWKAEYRLTQSARITLGLLLACLSVLAFVNNYYLLFLIAPILAWNGDYALYARGFAIRASIIAFLRLLVPFSLIMAIALLMPEKVAPVYIGSIILIYFLTNMSISHFLKTDYFFKPELKNLHLYYKSLLLGVVVLSLYFIGLGLLLVIPYFYDSTVVAVSFVSLKFYVLFKGVLRIIHQAFIKEMISYEVCFKVDQIANLIGILFALSIIAFPGSFIRLFFGEKYLESKTLFLFLAVGALVYSLFSSLIIKAMLEKKDLSYAIVSFAAATATIVSSIIFSKTRPDSAMIGLSILIGEISFSSGMLLIMRRHGFISQRLLFFLKNIAIAVVFLTIRHFMGDTVLALISSVSLYGIIMLALNFKRFTLPVK